MKLNNFGGVPTGVGGGGSGGGGTGGGGTGGTAGGDLSGTLPGPTVVGVDGIPIGAPGTAASGDTLIYNAGSNEWDYGAGGGGASPLTTKGDLYGRSTVDARVPVGTNGQVLTADSTDAEGVSWQTPATSRAIPTVARAILTVGSVTLAASTTSMTNVDGTNLSLSITVQANSRIRILFAGIAKAGTANALAGFSASVDGTNLNGNDCLSGMNTVSVVSVGFTALTAALSAGSHTVNLRYINTGAGTGTLFGSGSGGFIMFAIEEVLT